MLAVTPNALRTPRTLKIITEAQSIGVRQSSCHAIECTRQAHTCQDLGEVPLVPGPGGLSLDEDTEKSTRLLLREH